MAAIRAGRRTEPCSITSHFAMARFAPGYSASTRRQSARSASPVRSCTCTTLDCGRHREPRLPTTFERATSTSPRRRRPATSGCWKAGSTNATVRYNPSSTRRRDLPRLAADRRTPVALVVAIPRRNLGDELLEGVGRTAMADHDRAVLDGHVDRVAFIDPCFERHRLGQAQPQAIAPFCDLR